ncbi:MAG TPA: DNRLRE domain-containing protein [Kineosporiaceae bacterium]|nr:DNRLRE domain-containing protein [Kineosporiaceae bacterium]
MVALLASALTWAGAAPADAATGDVVLLAAGDIIGSCTSTTSCDYAKVSDVILGEHPDVVLALGDISNNTGSLSDYTRRFRPTWGRFQTAISPVPGNHDYGTASAANYYSYFGSAAHGPAGYYSFDVGAWHVVALNSNCAKVGGCQTGSAEETWLRADLAANTRPCTAAFWHHPRYSSGYGGDNTATADLFADLYAARADVLLSGHSHDYERFAPQDNASRANPGSGIRQFVVGTGGAFFTGFSGIEPNSQAHQNTAMGALRLTLHQGSYDWAFRPVAGRTYSDTGSATCHRATAGPRTLTFTPTDDATIDLSRPTTNLGSATRLVADHSPVNDVLLRFAVSGLSGCQVSRAVLTLTVGTSGDDGSARGGEVHPAAATWSQSTVTWDTAPAPGPTVASLGAVSAGTSYPVDVTSQVTGDGPVGLRISSSSTDGARYFSTEGSATRGPRLTVSCG